MVDGETVAHVEAEMKRYLAVSKRVREGTAPWTFFGTPDTAALRRASMEVTRALAVLRDPVRTAKVRK